MSCTVRNLIWLKGFSENNELAFQFWSSVYKGRARFICQSGIGIYQQEYPDGPQLLPTCVHSHRTCTRYVSLWSRFRTCNQGASDHTFGISWFSIGRWNMPGQVSCQSHCVLSRICSQKQLRISYATTQGLLQIPHLSSNRWHFVRLTLVDLTGFRGTDTTAWGLFNSLFIKRLKDCTPDDTSCSCRNAWSLHW